MKDTRERKESTTNLHKQKMRAEPDNPPNMMERYFCNQLYHNVYNLLLTRLQGPEVSCQPSHNNQKHGAVNRLFVGQNQALFGSEYFSEDPVILPLSAHPPS